jgi:hypothetical protein
MSGSKAAFDKGRAPDDDYGWLDRLLADGEPGRKIATLRNNFINWVGPVYALANAVAYAVAHPSFSNLEGRDARALLEVVLAVDGRLKARGSVGRSAIFLASAQQPWLTRALSLDDDLVAEKLHRILGGAYFDSGVTGQQIIDALAGQGMACVELSNDHGVNDINLCLLKNNEGMLELYLSLVFGGSPFGRPGDLELWRASEAFSLGVGNDLVAFSQGLVQIYDGLCAAGKTVESGVVQEALVGVVDRAAEIRDEKLSRLQRMQMEYDAARGTYDALRGMIGDRVTAPAPAPGAAASAVAPGVARG